MSTKHTPGPWGIGSRSYDRGDALVATFPEGKPVAKVKRLPGNSWANARLIAEAPELLRQLEILRGVAYTYAMESIKLNPAIDQILLDADRVIKAAKGQPS